MVCSSRIREIRAPVIGSCAACFSRYVAFVPPPTDPAAALRRARATAQLLAGRPARAADEVARRLLAVQAQDLRAARLAVRVRTSGLTAEAVNRALGEDRSVVIGWLVRGTLHLVCAEDYPWLHGLAAPTQRQGNLRRLEQCGFTPDRADRAVAVIERLLEHGPLGREQIGRDLTDRGFELGDQALVHLLVRSSLAGGIVRGPLVGGRQTFVLAGDWLGRRPPARLDGEERQRALAELARRYLRGHGPACDADLALWAGLPLRDARAGLSAIAVELRQRADGTVQLLRPRLHAAQPPPRLLGAFVAYTLGWKDRDFAVPPQQASAVRSEGWIRPIAIVAGHALGLWSSTRRSGRLVVELRLWAQPGDIDLAALAADAEDVARFEGLAAAEFELSAAPTPPAPSPRPGR
jgi:Winged helix DNA-binding domain